MSEPVVLLLQDLAGDLRDTVQAIKQNMTCRHANNINPAQLQPSIWLQAQSAAGSENSQDIQYVSAAESDKTELSYYLCSQ